MCKESSLFVQRKTLDVKLTTRNEHVLLTFIDFAKASDTSTSEGSPMIIQDGHLILQVTTFF